MFSSQVFISEASVIHTVTQYEPQLTRDGSRLMTIAIDGRIHTLFFQ